MEKKETLQPQPLYAAAILRQIQEGVSFRDAVLKIRKEIDCGPKEDDFAGHHQSLDLAIRHLLETKQAQYEGDISEL